MLIITDTITINTDRIAAIKIDRVSETNYYISCDNYNVIGHLSETIAHTLYNHIIYSITSGKKTYNLRLHLNAIFNGGLL